ncbi:MAG: hypothetical protein AAFR65_11185 [Pseudomonadota bacterium]
MDTERAQDPSSNDSSATATGKERGPAQTGPRDTILIDVDARKFAKCWGARSHDGTRYYLAGVGIFYDDQGAVLVGTDGTKMIIARDRTANVPDTEDTRNGVIVTCSGDMVKRAFARGPVAPRLHVELMPGTKSGSATLFSNARRYTEHDVVINATYPNWRNAIKSCTEARTKWGVDPSLFAALVAHESELAKGIIVGISDDSNPTVVRFPDSDVVGVVMPMRVNGDAALPDWLAASIQADEPQQDQQSSA